MHLVTRKGTTMTRWRGLCLTTAILLKVVMICAALVVGCGEKKARPTTRFRPGDLVRMKVDGRRAMVTGIWYRYERGQRYWIRVGGPIQQRRDGLVSADTEITQYAEIKVWEFEIESDREVER